MGTSFDNHRLSQPFLFATFDSRRTLTARKVHIRRLYDILQLSLQRNDLTRARQAWAILARCKEIDWMTMWMIAVDILGEGMDKDDADAQKIEFLRTMMLQHPGDRERIIKELVLRLIMSGMYREALDELELYLPSFPCQDDPVLHVYAGLVSLYLAQTTLPGGDRGQNVSTGFQPILVREAQAHFERAKTLDADNTVANAFLEKIPAFVHELPGNQDADHGSDTEGLNMATEDTPQRQKRARVRLSRQ